MRQWRLGCQPWFRGPLAGEQLAGARAERFSHERRAAVGETGHHLGHFRWRSDRCRCALVDLPPSPVVDE